MTDSSSPDPGSYEPVLTVSASFGSGGSVLAPRLAEHYGMPFVDRLLTVDVTEEAARDVAEVTGGPGGHRSSEGLSGDEKAASPGNRLFTYLARAASVGTIASPMVLMDSDDELRERAESSLAGVATGKGAVILGRAAAVVLAERPRAYHIRLDGPAARRIRDAARIDGITEEQAGRVQVQTDRSRELWVKRLYHADPKDPKWYHLWVDVTVLGNDAAFDVITRAFDRFVAGGLA